MVEKARVLGSGSSWTQVVGIVVMVATALVAVTLPAFASQYELSVGANICTMVVLAVGLNFVVGYAGLLDLGYAAFFAVGAYSTAYLTVSHGWNVFQTIPVALFMALLAGLAVGYPSLRVRSDYLAIVTLGFGEMAYGALPNLEFLGGANGIYGVPGPHIAGREWYSASDRYVIAIVTVGIVLVIAGLLSRSHTARSWIAIREDERVAEAIGVPVVTLKLAAYVAGGLVAGLAGAFFASRIGAIDPGSFTFSLSMQVLVIVVLGGLGSIRGVVLAAIFLTLLPEIMRPIAEYRELIMAVALVVMVMWRPHGLLPAKLPVRRISGQVPSLAEAASPLTSTPTPLLEVDRVSCAFGGVTALRDVGFALTPGELVSIIGPNGAGKSTLLNCISGVQRPTTGSVTVLGRTTRRGAPHRIVRRGLGRTFQNLRLIDEFDCIGNVIAAHDPATGGRSSRVHAGSGSAQLRASGLLHAVGIAGDHHRRPSELSYGDQRRLEIARALFVRPALLLLDEPAAGMTLSERRDLAALIRNLADLGTTIVLIEHDIEFVMALSDRVVVLDRGQVICDGPPEVVRADARVIDAYLGPSVAPIEGGVSS